MSTQHVPSTQDLSSRPEFELACLFDDMDDPDELTVFTPEGNATATEWITIDREEAVPLDEIR